MQQLRTASGKGIEGSSHLQDYPKENQQRIQHGNDSEDNGSQLYTAEPAYWGRTMIFQHYDCHYAIKGQNKEGIDKSLQEGSTARSVLLKRRGNYTGTISTNVPAKGMCKMEAWKNYSKRLRPRKSLCQNYPQGLLQMTTGNQLSS